MSQNTAIAASSVKNDQVSAALAELEKDSLRKASASSRSSTSFSLYRVQSGDTLTNIAGKYGVSLDTLYALNGGRSNLETIRVGQNIRVPGSNQKVAVPPRPLVNTPPSAFPKKSQDIAEHTVQTGETASSIARQYGINFGELCAANGGIEKLNQLRPGMILKLPGSRSNTAVAASPKITERIPVTSSYTAKGAAEVYKVQSGETLWSISRKFNMPPTELLALNGMNRDTKVKVGDTVKVIRNK
jgi:LysM repeat protein